jgi:hypothetical protein
MGSRLLILHCRDNLTDRALALSEKAGQRVNIDLSHKIADEGFRCKPRALMLHIQSENFR